MYVWRLHEEKRTESHWIREDTLAHHESVEIAKFSSDGGSHILTAAGDTAYLWRQSAIGSGTGGQWEKEDILVGHSGDVRNATFAPSGSRILTSVDTAAYVWRQQDQDDAGRWKQEAVLENWGWSFVGATFGSEGSHILTVNSKGSASQLDSAAYVWRWMDGENGGRWEEADSLGGHPSFVRYAAFSPDESRIVTASNDSAYVWRRNGEGGVDKWEMEDVLGGHSGPVETASFSPDGCGL